MFENLRTIATVLGLAAQGHMKMTFGELMRIGALCPQDIVFAKKAEGIWT